MTSCYLNNLYTANAIEWGEMMNTLCDTGWQWKDHNLISYGSILKSALVSGLSSANIWSV